MPVWIYYMLIGFAGVYIGYTIAACMYHDIIASDKELLAAHRDYEAALRKGYDALRGGYEAKQKLIEAQEEYIAILEAGNNHDEQGRSEEVLS